MTYAIAIIAILLYFRVQYLRGYIRGQVLITRIQKDQIDQLKETIDNYADLVDRQRDQVNNLLEVVIDQNEQIVELQIDGQEIFDNILKERENGFDFTGG